MDGTSIWEDSTRGKSLKVLMVEDSEADVGLVVRELERSGYAVKWTRVQSAADLREALARESWDIVLSDYSMPAFSGPDALAVVKVYDTDLPFILISGTIGEEIAVRAIQAGASDYLLKDRLKRLAPAIERALREAQERRAYKQAQEALRTSEARYRTLFDEATEGVALADAETGVILDCNRAFAELTGYDRAELIGMHHRTLHRPEDVTDGVANAFDEHRNAKQGEVLSVELVTKSGAIKQVEIKANVIRIEGRPVLHGFFRDVTAEVRHRRERETAVRLLHLLNEQNDLHELVRGLTALLHEWTGCEAVGVRLRDGEDFPYFETQGFPAEFVEMENSLCERDASGEVIRDGEGNAILECMCGNILRGRYDPSQSFFTANGSFWSNCTTELLEATSEADRLARTRNRCNGAGYESVALIPLRAGGEMLGLLQLNDHAEGRFTSELLAFLESAAAQIAIALAHRKAQQALLESQAKLEAALASMADAVSISDASGQFIEFNDAFATFHRFRDKSECATHLSCYPDIIDVCLPNGERAPLEMWAVPRALRGETATNAEYTLRRKDTGETWVGSYSFSPIHDKNGAIAGAVIIGRDITERKEAEARLVHLNRVLRALRDVNQLITHEKDRDTLLRRACETLTEMRGYSSAWIGLLDAAGAIHAAAESGLGAGFAVVRARLERGEWPYCCRMALEKPGIVVIHDPEGNCAGCPVAHKYDDTAALAQRLEHAGCDYGVLVVALSAALADDPQEQSLFQEFCEDLGFALHAIEVGQERQRAENRLRESQVTLVAAQSVAHVGTWTWDVLSDEISGSDEFYRLFGVKPGQITQYRQFLSLLDPPDRKRVGQEVAEAMKQKQPYDSDYRVQLPNGEYRDINARGKVFVDDSGEPIRMVGTCLDITERRRTEEELRSLSMAVTQSPALVIITDTRGNIEYVNPKFIEVTGYAPEEVLGRNPRVLKSGETSREEYRRLWNTIRSGGEWRGEFHNKKKDGSLYWEKAHISPIRDADGIITHFLGIKEDITHQKSIEEQYRQAQKMEAVGQLAGGVAHDFNNILQAIVGYSAMLLDRLPEGDDTHEFAEEIAQGAERAAALTHQLLAFSRRQILKMEDLDLNDVVHGLTKMIRRIIGEDIDVKVLEGRRLGIVHADRGQMEQVLLNLSINARDAMPEGGVLSIETENVVMDSDYCEAHAWALPGRYVLLSVTDTGCGMGTETQARIFEPFFTTKELGKGTGLGLATVYGIVRQHQGMIQVYSEVGKGTAFKVYLPSVERPASAVGTKVIERARGGSETILVAEDDETLRKQAELILKEAGYTVFLANDGEEALVVFQKHAGEIDLFLLDVVMPRLGGKAVFDVLRQQQPRLRFLFSSGYSSNAIHADFVLKEGIELIQKPYAPDTLLRKVREVLDEGNEKESSE